MTSEKTHVLKTEEIVVKSIITKSNLPAASYVVNPYIGCQHGCIYCYSEFMKRFTNHHEPWGTFVDVKINAVNIIKPMKYKDKRLLFSSVTDAYQPIESKYELTRKYDRMADAVRSNGVCTADIKQHLDKFLDAFVQEALSGNA